MTYRQLLRLQGRLRPLRLLLCIAPPTRSHPRQGHRARRPEEPDADDRQDQHRDTEGDGDQGAVLDEQHA
ncbi:hypothetical protein ACWEBX_39965, partial [Streptomyces sp. NPDC005070]